MNECDTTDMEHTRSLFDKCKTKFLCDLGVLRVKAFLKSRFSLRFILRLAAPSPPLQPGDLKL